MTDRQGFFDRYPEFYDSWMHFGPKRPNVQYHAFIETNADAIRGKRILDLASNEGHWSFAALTAGATHVTGVEARPEHVAAATEYMARYSVPADRYEFIVGDALDSLEKFSAGEFDTVFCLGFLYHTMHHMAVLSQIARLRPETIIIDTAVAADRWPVVRLSEEDATHPGSSVADHTQADRVLVGTPSRKALQMMLDRVGYPQVEWFDWYQETQDNADHLEDYRDGVRASLSATPAGAR